MKLAVVCLLALVCAVLADDTYTTKFDNVDVDQILNSDRLLSNYFKCLMDRGRCTPDGAELKRLLPDALATECSKCTEKQKMISKKVIHFLVKNKPDMWSELVGKYDPERKYRVKYEKEAKDIGVEV